MLSTAGDDTKLALLVIVKGETGKTVESKLRKLKYVRNNNMFIYYHNNACFGNFLFKEWIKNIFIPYQKPLCEKCILIN